MSIVSRLLWKIQSCQESIDRYQAKAALYPQNAARYHQLIEKLTADIERHRASLRDAGYDQAG